MSDRVWIKSLPPKLLHKKFGLYKGTWFPQMDRCWESTDGISVCSRKIRTDWGVVEHVTVKKMWGDTKDFPWSLKQEIKDELFNPRSIAIEVFPDVKNLVDVCDVYHLWILPEKFKLPFGIHPTRDPQGVPVNRGYDYNLDEIKTWVDSDERKRGMGDRGIESVIAGALGNILDKGALE